MLVNISLIFGVWINFFVKKKSATLSACQSLDPDQDLHSIWVQIVCKGYQQKKKSRQLAAVFYNNDLGSF